MQDIVMPDGNEKEFIAMAGLLGYDSLTFLYPQGAKPQPVHDKGISISTAVLAGNPSRDQRMQFIGSAEPNRMFLEKFRHLNFFDFEASPNKDFIHHRNCGLNHVLAKLLHDREHAVWISLHGLISSNPIFAARKIGRIMMISRLARKYRFRMGLASFARTPYGMRNPSDLSALSRILKIG
ncbi:hypothetical protein JW968_05455 [Candidatus Woesearchaeota archaeon]|nr:hypothetical protein [Candidatus Woesearchaeota archaeon]